MQKHVVQWRILLFVLLALLFILPTSIQADDGVTVSSLEELTAALETKTDQLITLTQSIKLTDYIKMSGNHTLIIPEELTLEIASEGEINIGSYQLHINGGGSVLISGNGTILAYNGNEHLHLSNITLRTKDIGYQNLRVANLDIGSGTQMILTGAEESAIYLGPGFSLNLHEGASIDINDFLDYAVLVNGGTLHLDGGTLSVNYGIGEQIAVSVKSGTLHYEAGSITGRCGTTVMLSQSALVCTLEALFSDRGTLLLSQEQLRVEATNLQPSSTGLTAGYYNWNGSYFAKESIIINEMPQSISYSLIDGLQPEAVVLSVDAESTNGEAIQYQWYQLNEDTDDFEPIAGANAASITLPTSLTAGRHVYYCLMHLDGKMDVVSYDAIINVLPSEGYAQGSITLGGMQHDDLRSDAAGLGWRWNKDEASLTLTEEYTGQAIVISCRPADTIRLVLEGDASIEAEGTAIYCAGYLSIASAQGKNGSLTVVGNGSIDQSHAVISVEGYLRLDSGRLHVTANGTASCAIWTHEDIVVLESASLSAIQAGEEGDGIIIGGEGATYSCLTIRGGSVYASGAGFSYAIEVARSIDISSGLLFAVNEAALGSGAISAANLNISGSGSLLARAGVRGAGVSTESDVTISTTGTVEISTESPIFYEYALWTNSANVNVRGGMVLIENTGNESNLIFGVLNHTGGTINGSTPSEHEINTISFPDIESHWAYEDILYALERGLFVGTSATSFSPDVPISRGMFITVLGRLSGVNPSDYTSVSFDDVPSTAYFAPYVQWAVENGIARGVSETEFAPSHSIARQEAVTMLYRFTQLYDYDLLLRRDAVVFEDADEIADWAQEAVSVLYQAEVINGKPGPLYDPNGLATRAECCALLRRYLTNTV